jgi:hypothetical protein
VARALAASPSVTCVNLGENLLTPEVALGWKSLNLENNALEWAFAEHLHMYNTHDICFILIPI